MNIKSLRAFLAVKYNRQMMIDKIDKGFKKEDVKVTKDSEVEEFQRGMLLNWNNLDNFEPAAEDLVGLEGQEKKEKIEDLKNQFCAWISSDDAIAEGYSYAYMKKESIRSSMIEAGGSIKNKIKSGMEVIIGPKIGRNESCPCGSGKKYKKCCGGNQQ